MFLSQCYCYECTYEWQSSSISTDIWIGSYYLFSFSLPGIKKALGKYGPADVEDTTGAATDSKDDDDIDLFGSDDEEVLVT